MSKNSTLKLVLSAMFLAIGMILPFFTGQIQQIGSMLLPMHIPVFLCAFICGWQYAFAVGFSLPLLRSLIFGMPMLFPNAVSMALELAVYGIVAGFVYRLTGRKSILSVYVSMISAMILGRIIWGLAQFCLLGINGTAFSWQAFVAGAVTSAIPGIIIQLILVPTIVGILNAKGYDIDERSK